MSGAIGGNQDVDIDLGRLLSAVWKRKGIVLGATVLVGGVAFAAAMMMTPSYKGAARLLIETRGPNLSGQPVNANDPVLDALNITSQAELLRSSDLLRQVAGELHLYETEGVDAEEAGEGSAGEDRVLREFRENLLVFTVENSRVIAIEFSSPDPRLAAAVPNRMAEVYLSRQSDAKLDTHSETAKWLEPEIAILTEKVRAAEAKVAEYRASAGLFQATETASLAEQQLSNIAAELARVRAERANAEARAENVRAALAAGRETDTLAEVMSSQVVQRLKETEGGLRAQISEQSTVLLENHPRLKGLRAQLQGIRLQIDGETRTILASLDSEAEVSRIREQQLMQQLNGLKADAARAGGEEVGLRALEREAAAQRQLLETYLVRYREAVSRIDPNSTPADARIVSTAVEPSKPYFPKVVPIVIIAALATLIVSTVLIMIGELFSGRALRSPDEDEVATARDVVPAASAEQVLPVAGARGTDLEEPPAVIDKAFSIDTASDYLLRHGIPLAVVVSPGGDAGSTATVMLARNVAEQDKSVLLLDMTGSACPTRLMAISPRLAGITDLLCGDAAFGEAIHPDRLSGAHIVPHGTADAAVAMSNAGRLGMVIDALTQAYDLVLVECGATDAVGISHFGANKAGEVILSAPGVGSDEIADLVQDFHAGGYTNLLVMTSAGGAEPRHRRNAA